MVLLLTMITAMMLIVRLRVIHMTMMIKTMLVLLVMRVMVTAILTLHSDDVCTASASFLR